MSAAEKMTVECTPRQIAIGNALDFLREAAEALDQAESELRAAGLRYQRPTGLTRKVDRRCVFPATNQPPFWLSKKHELDVGDITDAVIALYRTVAEPDESEEQE